MAAEIYTTHCPAAPMPLEPPALAVHYVRQ
ncbi:hypothetical protein CGRA01v4_00554 [Colletotrichum graminicola]|nr:hypothetical protein CGRA01v4_00554 [Colletotrichum graminicola]